MWSHSEPSLYVHGTHQAWCLACCLSRCWFSPPPGAPSPAPRQALSTFTHSRLLCRFDTIVAAGGDGTLNEVVGALLAHRAPQDITVAQLPLGTANDLASAAGISLVGTLAALPVATEAP
jgi:hypothetical protein